MTLKNIKGRIVKIEDYHWSAADLRRACDSLNDQFNAAPFAPETIQEMINSLISDFGDDPREIERVIIAHFMKG